MTPGRAASRPSRLSASTRARHAAANGSIVVAMKIAVSRRKSITTMCD
jgi:hypothetical protein